MAKNTSIIFLGYDDEQITDKQIPFVDFTTNKIGGKPVSSSDCVYLNLCKIKRVSFFFKCLLLADANRVKKKRYKTHTHRQIKR